MLKVLQLCNKSPLPLVDGGCIAMKASADAILLAGNNLKILAIETPKHPFIKLKENADFIKSTGMETVYIDSNIKISDAFFNLFSNKSYHVTRFWSENFNEKLIATLQNGNFDIIQLESVFVAPYIDTIRTYSKDSKIILRAHNLENEIWFKFALREKNPLKSFYYNLLARRLKEYEQLVVKKVDAVAAISINDANKFKKFSGIPNLKVIPLNMEANPDWKNESNKISFFFIGSLDWLPNIEGLNWFLRSVWPEINKQMPDLTLYIAGKKMPDKMKNRKIPGVIFEGEVENARTFMASKKVMIVPLLSGSGVRVKILEAMGYGKTVISTSQGAEGLGCEKNKNILIADSAKEFIYEITKCVNNPAFCIETGLNAITFVKNTYSAKSIATQYTSLYNSVLNKEF